jgi:hypothetical protein
MNILTKPNAQMLRGTLISFAKGASWLVMGQCARSV